MRRAAVLIGLAVVLASTVVPADQTGIRDYDRARDVFWERLYPSGGWYLYCDQPFQDRDGDPTSSAPGQPPLA